ncbi:GlcG/HbpS family heme-binding protein [Lichenibacterium ramalinae]|uniref:Heme-binding protein n=1 Tax=Lichenibacterium ramalinae TaxID=2316527 RepID=A0A4Q2RDS5_9HYPH|nr:heme-binding protein [Lichenibacterium ramalinae]RYB05602.1 heme-binding protein [Lichenibacterium ramalinae]
MLSLDHARTILDVVLKTGTEKGFKPLAAVVLDARGAMKAFAAQDGTSLKRGEIARGKADGALAMGLGSRAIAKMAAERPAFVAAATHAVGGSLVPVPGGVLILQGGEVVGAVGVSGDLSDNDEICAVAGIEAAGLKADTGA